MPYIIFKRLITTLKSLKSTRPVTMILQRKKQILIFIPHLSLFYLKLSITTVENANFQCKVRLLFDSVFQFLYITTLFRKRLNLKIIASCNVRVKVFSNYILQAKLDLVDAKPKCTENKAILCPVEDICQT